MKKEELKNRAKVYKHRLEKKIEEGKVPTLTELKTLKEAGIDTSKYAKFAIEKYKPFLEEKKNA